MPDHHRHPVDSLDPVTRALEPWKFERTWACTTCGQKVTIRTQIPRDDGPSNFVVDTNPKARTFGHGLIPPSRLNWEGLREERGLERDGDRILCPACVQGRTHDEHRLVPIARRVVEIAARHITRQSAGAIAAEAVFTRLLR